MPCVTSSLLGGAPESMSKSSLMCDSDGMVISKEDGEAYICCRRRAGSSSKVRSIDESIPYPSDDEVSASCYSR